MNKKELKKTKTKVIGLDESMSVIALTFIEFFDTFSLSFKIKNHNKTLNLLEKYEFDSSFFRIA